MDLEEGRRPRRAVRSQLAAHPGLAPSQLEILARDESWRVRATLAQNPAIGAELVDRLVQDPHRRVRLRISRRADLTAEQLDRLAGDASPFVREHVACHPSTPAAALARLSTDPVPAVRYGVARHPACPAAVLHALAGDSSPSVALAVASHRGTPPDALARLLADTPPHGARIDESLRRVAAANPSTPSEALARLERMARTDRSWGRILAANPATPPKVLADLARDGEWDVQLAAAANPATPERARSRLLRSPWSSVRAAVAATTTDPLTQALLFEDLQPQVRFALAGNPNAGPELLRRLGGWNRHRLRGDDAWTLGRALANPALPADIVHTLLDQDDLPPWVLRTLCEHPACPAEQRDAALTWIALGGAGPGDPAFDPLTCDRNPDDAAEPLDAFFDRQAALVSEHAGAHPLWRVRARALARRPELPLTELRQVNRDERTEVRRLASRFRGTDDELDVLLGDADAPVRRQAAATRHTPAPTAPAAGFTPQRRPSGRVLVAVFVALAVAGAITNDTDRPPDASATDDEQRPFRAEVALSDGELSAVTAGGPFTATDVGVTIRAGAHPLSLEDVWVAVGERRWPCSPSEPTRVDARQQRSFTCATGASFVWTLTVRAREQDTGKPVSATIDSFDLE